MSEWEWLNSLISSSQLTLLIKSKVLLFFLYAMLSMLVYLCATPAYVFALLKYKERLMIEEALFLRTFSSKMSKLGKFEKGDTKKSKLEKDDNELDQQFIQEPCCFNYCPHLIATIQLVLMCACKLPFCYDYIIYYNKAKDFGVMLVIISSEILHTIILIFIWLLLTLKINWNMHLQTGFSICHWTYHLR